jgi:hypothetical protein
MSLETRIKRLVLALGASASMYACGPNSDPIETPDTGNCQDSKADQACNQLDAGYDAGNPDSGITNKAPVVDGITIANPSDNRIYSNNSPTQIRAGMNLRYNIDASDPDGDALQCKYTFKDSSGQVVWASNDYVACSLEYGLNGSVGENCSLETIAKDSKGKESNLARVDLELVDNLAPVLNVKVSYKDTNEEILPNGTDNEGRPIYNIEVNKTFCLDGNNSYDLDGEITKYTFKPSENTNTTFTGKNVCTGLTRTNEVNSTYIIKDNESKETILKFIIKSI